MKPNLDIAGNQARILIVDDDHDNREVLELVLAWEGYLIVTACSGEEALAIMAKEPPDLVLLDVMMPGMSGCEVAAEIRGNPATKNIPIMLLTALDNRTARTLALSAGAEDVLIKPLDRAELCGRVGNLLRVRISGVRPVEDPPVECSGAGESICGCSRCCPTAVA
jgi:diguanylate cyclase